VTEPRDPRPGDIVDWSGKGQFVVVDTADYRDDRRPDDLFCPLRYQDGDPRRKANLNPDGSDLIIDAPRAKELRVIGHI
jgi:hypothetical protein